jgi:SAM-dependent methyltransferase
MERIKSLERRFLERELDKILSKLNELKGKKILDAGAKDERYSKYFKTSSYCSIDLNPVIKSDRMIKGDLHILPFQDNTFDLILSVSVIEHTKWPWEVFEELSRILKPKGKLIISWPWLYVFTHEDYWRIHIQGMKWLAKKHQMEIEYWKPIGGLITNMSMQLNALISAKIKNQTILSMIDKFLFYISSKDSKHFTKNHATDFIAIIKKF